MCCILSAPPPSVSLDSDGFRLAHLDRDSSARFICQIRVKVNWLCLLSVVFVLMIIYWFPVWYVFDGGFAGWRTCLFVWEVVVELPLCRDC